MVLAWVLTFPGCGVISLDGFLIIWQLLVAVCDIHQHILLGGVQFIHLLVISNGRFIFTLFIIDLGAELKRIIKVRGQGKRCIKII